MLYAQDQSIGHTYLAVDKKGASIQLLCCFHARGQGGISPAVHHTHLNNACDHNPDRRLHCIHSCWLVTQLAGHTAKKVCKLGLPDLTRSVLTCKEELREIMCLCKFAKQ